MGSDQSEIDIYGILVTSLTSWSRYEHPSIKASVHAHYILACLGQYLGSIGLDQSEIDIFEILVMSLTSLSIYISTPRHES